MSPLIVWLEILSYSFSPFSVPRSCSLVLFLLPALRKSKYARPVSAAHTGRGIESSGGKGGQGLTLGHLAVVIIQGYLAGF